MSRTSLILLATVSFAFSVGCGGGGPVTYPVSGKVTHNGKPVPAGSVAFIPNAAQDNSGPQAYAIIKDGAFQTEAGSGHGGGPYLVQVDGFDGIPVEGGEGMDPNGTALFPQFQMSVDLPEGSKTLDIEVPATSE